LSRQHVLIPVGLHLNHITSLLGEWITSSGIITRTVSRHGVGDLDEGAGVLLVALAKAEPDEQADSSESSGSRSDANPNDSGLGKSTLVLIIVFVLFVFIVIGAGSFSCVAGRSCLGRKCSRRFLGFNELRHSAK
jgi:hypothetical protein